MFGELKFPKEIAKDIALQKKKKRWVLSPVYDLTYSNSIGGEHATCVNGSGKNPGMKDLLEVGKRAGISEKKPKTLQAK